MRDTTELYYNGQLLNTIDNTSTFKSIPNAKVETKEEREKVARSLADGWIQNAGYDPSRFEIRHGKTKPIQLSKMAEDILRKGRDVL